MHPQKHHSPATGRTVGAGLIAPSIGLVLALGMSWLIISTLVSTFDPLERERRSAELSDQKTLQDETYGARLFASKVWTATPAVAGLVLLTGGSVIALLIAYRHLAAWQTIRVNKMIALTRARVQRFPDGLQTLAFHDSSRDAPQLAPPEWGDEPGDIDVHDLKGAPPFEELLSEFGPGRPRILGRDLATGELVRLAVDDLFNIGCGGASGTGKSWTMAALAAQHILAGGKLVVIDPHGRKDDGLTPRLLPFAPAFFCKPAIDDPDIAAVAAMVRGEVERRRAGRKGRPWLVIVDEYARLMRSAVGEAVGGMVEELGQEGRGFGVTALVASQVWNGTRAGGSEVRDALSSHILHRLRPNQARMLTGLPAEALPSDLHALPKGHFILLDANGEMRRVAAPRMSADAVAKVAALLTPQLPEAATGETVDLSRDTAATCTAPPTGNTSGTGQVQAKNTLPSDVSDLSERASVPLDPDTARILSSFAAGASLHELAGELAGTSNPNAKLYREARARVEAALRQLVPGGNR